MIIDLPTKRIWVTAEWQTFLSVLPIGWRRKPVGIDMELIYVTDTLCIHGSRDSAIFLLPYLFKAAVHFLSQQHKHYKNVLVKCMCRYGFFFACIRRSVFLTVLLILLDDWHNLFTYFLFTSILEPSVLWRCWLGGRKGIRPVKTEWWGAGIFICLERGADLHMAQLMPLSLTVSCFSKIQIGLTFLVPADPGSPGKRAVKWVCVLYVLDGMVAGLGGHSHVQKVGHAPYDRCNNPQLQRESY